MAYQLADKLARMAAQKPLTDKQYEALHNAFLKQRRRARREVIVPNGHRRVFFSRSGADGSARLTRLVRRSRGRPGMPADDGWRQ